MLAEHREIVVPQRGHLDLADRLVDVAPCELVEIGLEQHPDVLTALVRLVAFGVQPAMMKTERADPPGWGRSPNPNSVARAATRSGRNLRWRR